MSQAFELELTLIANIEIFKNQIERIHIPFRYRLQSDEFMRIASLRLSLFFRVFELFLWRNRNLVEILGGELLLHSQLEQ